MQIPLLFLDATAIEEVPVELWKRLFGAIGSPGSLLGIENSLSHAAILAALQADVLSDELLLALETLHTLGTETGRAAIAEAMTDRRAEPSLLPSHASERELAVYLFLAQREHAVAAEVFTRAQAQVQEGTAHRRYNEFLGKGARPVTALNGKAEALKKYMLTFCRAHDLGEHVQVRAFEDDGVYVIQVLRSDHVKKPLAVLPGQSARATIQYRPVHADILRYESTVGRLRIAARAASMVEVYRRAAGEVLFDDEQFFYGDAVCSLAVLQERGRAVLSDHSVAGVGRVWMTECLWERGDRDLLHIRSTDCFRNIEELHLPLTEGHILQAKLKLEVVGRGTRPVTVTIRAPSRIEITQKAHEQLIDEFLTKVGIRMTRGSSAAATDLWALHPWRHPASVWRALFGRDMDGLVMSGVLSRIPLHAIPSASHPSAGNVLDAQALGRGEHYGVSGMPEVPSASLSATDVEGLELTPEQFGAHLRAKLGLVESAPPWETADILDLGALEVGGHRLRIFYALREPAVGVGDRMLARAAGELPVVLLPTTRAAWSECAKVLLGEPIPSRRRVIRLAVAALYLGGSVPAIETAPDNARLIVDSQLGRVWVDGVEVPGLNLGTQPFRFVEILARRCPQPVSSEELRDQISGARDDGDTVVRQAKSTAKKLIKSALARSGQETDEDLFPSGPPGSYRAVIHSYVV